MSILCPRECVVILQSMTQIHRDTIPIVTLGLFPQSSKIAIHEISNIDDEIKRISKPLFEEELDDEKKPDIGKQISLHL